MLHKSNGHATLMNSQRGPRNVPLQTLPARHSAEVGPKLPLVNPDYT